MRRVNYTKDKHEDDYPNLICRDCALKNDGYDEGRKYANYYFGECGWCRKFVECTMPKNWGYPKLSKKKKINDY